MRIDRNNYEEFFILYVDNELSPTDRLDVEEFAQRHPDLEEELVMLQQSKLIPGHIFYEGKEELIKEESDSLTNIPDYQEEILLYVDNELSAVRKTEFEKIAAQHPQIQKDIHILLQTKLQPEEEIVFANKEILYRKEEKVRVISIRWWRVAAAAVVILAIGGTIFSILNRNTATPAEESVVVEKTPDNNSESIIKKTEEQVPPDQNNNDNIAVTSPSSENEKKTVKQNPDIANRKKTNKESVKEPKKNEPVIVQNNNLPEPEYGIAKKEFSNDPVDIPALNEYSSPSKGLVKPSDVVTIAYSDPSEFEESKNKKFRGLFRKATRIFERTTNISATNEDDRLLIAGLTVKLK